MLIRQLQQNKWHFSPHSLFTKDLVMKPYWKSLIREGEGGWLRFPFAPINVLHSRGERALCIEEAPRSGREIFLSFLYPGFESMSSQSPWQSICQCIVPEPLWKACPQCRGDRQAHSSAREASPKCRCSISARKGHFQRAVFLLLNLC